jgi:RNA polymerase sigma factor (sigma-70 family)
MMADVTAAFPGDHEAGIRVLGDARPRRGVPARLLRLASDERLVEYIRAGSEPAFEALFDRHHRGVLGFCRHMLGSVEEAEDAVQHTFLAAYRQLVGSDKQVHLRPWLYTIARNRCLTALRTRGRQAMGELADPPTEHLAAEVERRHELRDLLRDVAGLPEDQRAALVLAELGDMSHDDIADVLGCRRDKVKALVFQARSSLIASRTARDTPCIEIREQLANLRGGALRRNELRRHLSECPGCREFRSEVRAQRNDLALVLPVAPTVGLKSAVLGGAAAGGVAAAGGTAATGVLAAKVLVVAALAGGGTVAVREIAEPSAEPASRAAPAATRTHTSPAAPATARTRRPATPAAATAPGRVRTKPEHAARPERATPPGHAKAAKPEKATPPGHAKAGKPEKAPPGQAKAAQPEKTTPPGQAKAAKPEQATPPGHAKAAEPIKAATPVRPLKAAEPAKPAQVADPPGLVRAAKPIQAESLKPDEAATGSAAAE